MAAELGHFPHLAAESYSLLGINDSLDLPGESPYRLKPTLPVVGWLTFLRHLSARNTQDAVQEY